MKEENHTRRWSAGRLRREAFSIAVQGRPKRSEGVIDMGETASGRRRFPSRVDGAEAGIVRNGIRTMKA